MSPIKIGPLDHRVTGGFGILLDDLVAGAMAWCLLQVVAPWR